MYSWGEKLDDLLLNLVVVFEAKGVTLFQAAESAGLGKLCWQNFEHNSSVVA